MFRVITKPESALCITAKLRHEFRASQHVLSMAALKRKQTIVHGPELRKNDQGLGLKVSWGRIAFLSPTPPVNEGVSVVDCHASFCSLVPSPSLSLSLSLSLCLSLSLPRFLLLSLYVYMKVRFWFQTVVQTLYPERFLQTQHRHAASASKWPGGRSEEVIPPPAMNSNNKNANSDQ